jgi:hypothetical protein
MLKKNPLRGHDMTREHSPRFVHRVAQFVVLSHVGSLHRASVTVKPLRVADAAARLAAEE